MNGEFSQDLLESLRSRETDELLDLMKSKAQAKEDDDELSAIKYVLERRQQRFPNMAKAPTPAPKRKEMHPLGVDSNASVCELKQQKIEIHFPKQGFLQRGESNFKNQEELVSYLSEVFSLTDPPSGTRLSVKRKGKYQRIDRTGKSIFTFGDPILDIITDEHGWLSVRNETYNLLRLDLASPANRNGGITSIDLSMNHEEIRRQQLAEAVSATGTRTLLEYNSDRIILATTNPSELNFWMGSSHMKFRSWKKNWGVYKSIGTEIETWGGDFSSASIESTYADPVVTADPFVCGIVKYDSDSDTNDDYVDEYESEWGPTSTIPSTVRSYCEARWKGEFFNGTVSKGDCVIFV